VIINTQQLRVMFDELQGRVKTLESEMSFIKKGELPPLPAKSPDPEPEPPPKPPQGGVRHWGSGAGQMDSFTSHRLRTQNR